MADAAVGFLLENLKHLLLYNADLLGDAKNQVEGLHKDLILFKAFIKDSTEKRTTNHTLQALVDNIKSVVDKAEDAIDRFVVEKAKYRARNPFGKAAHVIVHSVTIRDVAKLIESIRKEVKRIYEEKQFGFQTLTRTGDFPERNAQRQSPTVEEDNVVGFDEEAKTVINRLIKGNMDLDIITIIGMPGLGKTTLARKVYNDQAVEYEFFTRAWIFVSQNYSRREIFLSLLSIFVQTTVTAHKSDDQLADELRKHLEKGKYLIVVDDVWAEGAWDDLKRAFPNNKKGSRILITSRNNKVATHANPTNGTHDLKFLTTKESLELLEKKVFGTEKCSSDELQTLGLQIAAKCEELPLAIVVIAGILLNNRASNDWWKQVAENVSSFVITDQERFTDVLALSYNHLPYHLKSCFLYLGVFPEDYEIPVWRLIHLWIAEGFIEENGDLNLEELAEACVDDLKEAEKQNFYQEIKKSEQATLGPSEKHRRVCIHSGVMNYLSSRPKGERVRSFLSFAPDEIAMPRDAISIIPKAFKLLRVLDIKSISFDIFPKDILHLALLRYIAICYLKDEFWKMYQLRHLRTNASAILPPPSPNTPKGRESVQSLSTIAPESCTEQVLERTPNIKKLGVRGRLAILLANGSNLFDNIGKLQHITNLKLFNDVYQHLSDQGKRRGLPPAYKFPTKLKKLTLSDTKLDWKYMQIFGNLEKLEVVKLKDNAFKGAIWQPEDGGCRSLKVLFIGRTDLVHWQASSHHFPSLQRLVLRHCERLEAVPIGLADLTSFQVLEIYRTPKAAGSAKAIQQKKFSNDTRSNGGFKLSIYPPDV
ncbi:antimicrobial response protein [Lithospermum erythrorhizon]|uniref:Antimicrobial response protein n=1 Tax=Lithospermum erythrorhizon TaxID=34254 RepID=A0AAV3NXA5_LITER